MNTKSQDTNQETTTGSVAETITEKLKNLGAEYKGARNVLYGILAKCLALVIEIDGDDDQEWELEKYLKKMKRPVKGGTKIYTKVIKAIVDIDRKSEELSHAKISKYATVLEQGAVAQRVPANLVEWIKHKGGIEAIVSKANSVSKDKTDKFECGKQFIREQDVVATVESITSFNTDEELVVLIGRPDGLGKIAILNFCPDQSVLKSICVKASKTLSVDAEVEDVKTDADENDEVDSPSPDTNKPAHESNTKATEECAA